MAVNNSLPTTNNDIPIEDATVYITKKTVKFGSDVYQFRNITGFGISTVKAANIYPMQFILGMFVIGLLIANIPDVNARVLGILLIIFAIISLIANYLQPKKYGLKLYLNSGSPSPIFITTNREGLEEIVLELYKFMESNEEGTYKINVVHGNMEGIFIGGDAGGTVTNRIRRRNLQN
ncbi:MAG: DUF6232 family protein [Actinomycetota bacterium]